MTTNKRSVLLGVVAAVLVAMAPGRSLAQCSGDPTGGGITGADVSAILSCVNNPSNPACATLCGGQGLANCADVNVDGVVNIFDAVAVANEAAGDPCPLNPVPICAGAGPQLACGSTIASDITTNTVLGGCDYFLDGTIFVEPGVVLTIRPGARIQGRTVSSDGTPSALIFLRGDCAALAGDNKPAAGDDFSARVNAVGTPNAPIVFTSDAPAGAKASGQWAGVAFNACSQVNQPGGEGTAEGLVGVAFGGAGNEILDESSGVARYIRAEFAGRELSPNNELNVWTMNALGSCTKFDYIQAHTGTDDGFEWFGGTNNATHLVSTANRDDNIDIQLGTEANIQYVVIQQTVNNLDTGGSNGFEWDNNDDGRTNTPYSNPTACNFTSIGEPNALGGTNAGILVREGTAGQIAKGIVTCFDDAGLRLEDAETAVHACSAGPGFTLAFQTAPQLLVQATVWGDNDNDPSTGDNVTDDCGINSSVGSECPTKDWCALLNSAAAFPAGLGGAPNTNVVNSAVSIPCTFGQMNPHPSIAAEADNTFACGTEFGAFFENNDFSGAINPDGSDDWMTTPGGWINFSLN